MHTVGRSGCDRGQTESQRSIQNIFFLKSKVKPLRFFDAYKQIGQGSSEILAIKLTRVYMMDARLQ